MRRRDTTGRSMSITWLAGSRPRRATLSHRRHRIAGQSIMAGTLFEKALVKNGVDGTSVEGVADMPYAVPNLPRRVHSTTVGVPVLWWRSGRPHPHRLRCRDPMMDQLAAKAGKRSCCGFALALLKGQAAACGH